MSSSDEESASLTTHWWREEADKDTLRVMLSTDNHLGFAERDPVRGMDSFAAFEEVLYLAKHFHCDMVLIAGDLFHENRPSRRTLHKTMEILKRYCMGPNPVNIQILSKQNFRSVDGIVNYQDENYSVDLPVFSIHGNHDDPSRDAGGELLAALDLLAVCNLVNYFGRHEKVDKVDISPVIIQKGETQVALYGMGSMRDERLHRMWNSQKVRFLRPDQLDCFNIFALHQNRDLGRGSKNCVHESMIPEWMDLVVWGHEHECLIEFAESVVGTFRITQPGSSVATSLVAGEAVVKKVGVLDIKGKNFRMHPVPLTQVRSFVTTEVSLKEHKLLDPDDPKIDSKVTEILEEEVRVMVLHARDKMKEVRALAVKAGNGAAAAKSPLRYTLEKSDEVLVRIRVEHSGFSSLNNQRFGARFVGDVANPTDILLFHRRKEGSKLTSKQKIALLKNPIAPEEMDRTNMEDLVLEHLQDPARALKLLDKKKLSEALEEYVDKNVTNTIPDTANSLLKNQQKKLLSLMSEEGEDEGPENASRIRELVEQESQAKKDKEPNVRRMENATFRRSKRTIEDDQPPSRSQEENGKETIIEGDEEPDSHWSKASGTKKALMAPLDSQRKAVRRKQLLELDSDNDDEMVAAAPVSSRTSSRPRRSSNRVQRYDAIDDLEDEESDAVIDGDDDVDDDDDDEPPATKKRPSRSSPRKKVTASQSPRKASRTRKNPSRMQDSDDDDAGYYNDTADVQEDWGTAQTRSQI